MPFFSLGISMTWTIYTNLKLWGSAKGSIAIYLQRFIRNNSFITVDWSFWIIFFKPKVVVSDRSELIYWKIALRRDRVTDDRPTLCVNEEITLRINTKRVGRITLSNSTLKSFFLPCYSVIYYTNSMYHTTFKRIILFF